MRGITKPANYGVRIAKLDWYLCYDCMMEYVATGKGEVVENPEHTRRYWALINDMVKQIKEQR